MPTLTCHCGKTIDETQGYTYQGELQCETCYTGKSGLGPLAEQHVPCPKCGQILHRFAIVCPACGVSIREIGKIDSVARGNVGKGIAFVVGILVLALLSMGLGDRAVGKGLALGPVIGLATGGLLLGVNAMLGLFYFRPFALVTFLQGITGFLVGAVCLIASATCYVLMI
jgi:hypothetical protein